MLKKKNQLGSLQCGILTPETLCVSQSVFLASVTISHVGLLAENTVQKNNWHFPWQTDGHFQGI